jgi:hypothetical protein
MDLPPEQAGDMVENCKKTLGDGEYSIDFRKTVFYGLCKGCQAPA